MWYVETFMNGEFVRISKGHRTYSAAHKERENWVCATRIVHQVEKDDDDKERPAFCTGRLRRAAEKAERRLLGTPEMEDQILGLTVEERWREAAIACMKLAHADKGIRFLPNNHQIKTCDLAGWAMCNIAAAAFTEEWEAEVNDDDDELHTLPF